MYNISLYKNIKELTPKQNPLSFLPPQQPSSHSTLNPKYSFGSFSMVTKIHNVRPGCGSCGK
jgi:hypothetical protein